MCIGKELETLLEFQEKKKSQNNWTQGKNGLLCFTEQATSVKASMCPDKAVWPDRDLTGVDKGFMKINLDSSRIKMIQATRQEQWIHTHLHVHAGVVESDGSGVFLRPLPARHPRNVLG
jgi:hypothetical protein